MSDCGWDRIPYTYRMTIANDPDSQADHQGMRVRSSTLPPEDLLIHRLEEIVIRLGVPQFVDQEFHSVGRAHRHQDTAQYPHF